MPGRFRIFEKHRVHRTNAVIVVCDLSHGSILATKEGQAEQRTAAQIQACTFVGPDPEAMTKEQADAAMATPLPLGWTPTSQLCSSPKEVGEEFSTAQVIAIVAHITRLSTPTKAELSTFRGDVGEAAGAEPGSNGATVGSSPIGATPGIP